MSVKDFLNCGSKGAVARLWMRSLRILTSSTSTPTWPESSHVTKTVSASPKGQESQRGTGSLRAETRTLLLVGSFCGLCHKLDILEHSLSRLLIHPLEQEFICDLAKRTGSDLVFYIEGRDGLGALGLQGDSH